MAAEKDYTPQMNARLEQSFREADQAREDLTDSMANSVAANCDLLHHGLISAKGLEVTTEMYRHLLGNLLRHPSGEVRAQTLMLFNEAMEEYWPRLQGPAVGKTQPTTDGNGRSSR
ncbi:hypothetical protein [Hymenobacter perfusus]|uniref:Uncharacterized protein n=1 Tax=Hymenobacter perfusus TaxID=1236770 RepID=A0A3R9V1Q8_9BACT|nr:hypothetical protein [Hymenobacter perfusus]RSK44812.1 hypothetical protein EI293_09915 [Hymenobacter perfusus]